MKRREQKPIVYGPRPAYTPQPKKAPVYAPKPCLFDYLLEYRAIRIMMAILSPILAVIGYLIQFQPLKFIVDAVCEIAICFIATGGIIGLMIIWYYTTGSLSSN